jgi:hypothetical protein
VNDFVLDFFDQRLKEEPVNFPAAALAAHPTLGGATRGKYGNCGV